MIDELINIGSYQIYDTPVKKYCKQTNRKSPFHLSVVQSRHFTASICGSTENRTSGEFIWDIDFTTELL